MSYPNTPIAGVNFDGVDLTQRFALGTSVLASDGGRKVYVRAAAAITQYSIVHIDSAWDANMITSALAVLSGKIGKAEVSVSASGGYFWASLSWQNTLIRVLGSCVKDVPLYTCDTAGALDDATASATHFQVMGVMLMTTNGTTGASVIAGNAAGEPMIRRPQP